MSNIDTINVGGLDYSIEDSTAREEATSAITVSAYVENGNTASRAYPVIGTPVNWKGTLYYTSATIAQGATLSTSNLTAATNLGQYLITRTNRIKTYVGSDSKLHFTDATGADSVLPFSSSSVPQSSPSYSSSVSGAGDWYSKTVTVGSSFNTSKLYYVELQATVDGVNPLSSIAYSGATVMWSTIRTLINHKFYAAFIKPTSTTVNMTISSPYANTDRSYSWWFYLIP